MYGRTTYETEARTPTLINWRGVFGGAVIGIGMLILLSTLWLALAFRGDSGVVRENLEWFLGGTAIFSLFVAGYLAGVISGARGVGAGLVQALTLWSLVLIVTLAIAVPSVMRLFNLDTTGVDAAGATAGTAEALWPAFWSMLVALGATLLGGLLGGATPRGGVPATGVTEEHHDVERTYPTPATEPTRTDALDRERRVS